MREGAYASGMESRTALVTGGNRGIGLETCRQLGREGMRVILTSRGEGGAEVARSLVGEGLRVEHRALDVGDAASVSDLAGRLRAEGLVIGVLVNNAAVRIADSDARAAERTLEVNFFGALRVTEALLAQIPDGGNVVMVSSGLGELSCVSPELRKKLMDPALTRDGVVALMRSFVEAVADGSQGKVGWPSSAYAVSKVGMNALVRVLAPELAARRVRINAVSPGWVRTEMGGKGAPRSVEVGAASVVWAAAPASGPTGGFFQDGHALDW
jgi:NAD(P)-dependent dehydrogenase (short-subunit alcohol dehydrogenase family)